MGEERNWINIVMSGMIEHDNDPFNPPGSPRTVGLYDVTDIIFRVRHEAVTQRVLTTPEQTANNPGLTVELDNVGKMTVDTVNGGTFDSANSAIASDGETWEDVRAIYRAPDVIVSEEITGSATGTTHSLTWSSPLTTEIRVLGITFDGDAGTITPPLEGGWTVADSFQKTWGAGYLMYLDTAIDLDGTTDYASVPDEAALDLGTGSAEIIFIDVDLSADDWTPAGTQTIIHKDNAYKLELLATGKLRFSVYSGTFQAKEMASALPAAVAGERLRLRVVYTPKIGPDSYTGFALSSDGGVTYNFLEISIDGWHVADASTDALRIGADAAGANAWAGQIYGVKVGPAGPPALDINFTGQNDTETVSFVAATGQTVTLAGNAYIGRIASNTTTFTTANSVDSAHWGVAFSGHSTYVTPISGVSELVFVDPGQSAIINENVEVAVDASPDTLAGFVGFGVAGTFVNGAFTGGWDATKKWTKRTEVIGNNTAHLFVGEGRFATNPNNAYFVSEADVEDIDWEFSVSNTTSAGFWVWNAAVVFAIRQPTAGVDNANYTVRMFHKEDGFWEPLAQTTPTLSASWTTSGAALFTFGAGSGASWYLGTLTSPAINLHSLSLHSNDIEMLNMVAGELEPLGNLGLTHQYFFGSETPFAQASSITNVPFIPISTEGWEIEWFSAHDFEVNFGLTPTWVRFLGTTTWTWQDAIGQDYSISTNLTNEYSTGPTFWRVTWQPDRSFLGGRYILEAQSVSSPEGLQEIFSAPVAKVTNYLKTAGGAISTPMTNMFDPIATHVWTTNFVCDQYALTMGDTPGTSGNYFSVPNDTAFIPTATMEIEVKVSRDDSLGFDTFLSIAENSDESWTFYVDSSDQLGFAFWTGGSWQSVNSTPHSFTATDLMRFKVTVDFATGLTSFYENIDGSAWTALGAPTNTIGVPDVGTNLLLIGGEANSLPASINGFNGKFLYTKLTVDGDVVLEADFTEETVAASTFVAASLQTVTVVGTAAIVADTAINEDRRLFGSWDNDAANKGLGVFLTPDAKVRVRIDGTLTDVDYTTPTVLGTTDGLTDGQPHRLYIFQSGVNLNLRETSTVILGGKNLPGSAWETTATGDWGDINHSASDTWWVGGFGLGDGYVEGLNGGVYTFQWGLNAFVNAVLYAGLAHFDTTFTDDVKAVNPAYTANTWTVNGAAVSAGIINTTNPIITTYDVDENGWNFPFFYYKLNGVNAVADSDMVRLYWRSQVSYNLQLSGDNKFGGSDE